MKKRKIIILVAGVLILVLAVLSFNLFSPVAEKQQSSSEQAAPKTAVNTLEANPDSITSFHKITGRVVALENINLFAEVGGIASFGKKPFKTGVSFQKGDLLLSIDNVEFRNSLKASKSQFKSLLAQTMPDIKLDFPEEYEAWSAYLENLAVEKPLKPLPQTQNKQFNLFLAGRNLFSNFYSIQEQQSRLSKYYIRAPFKGAITESYIDRGTLIRVGQQLGEFISTGRFELESSVAYGMLDLLEKGQKMSFTDINKKKEYEGKLVRVNEKVDPASQLVKVYFEILDSDLRSGVYLEGMLQATTYSNAIRVSASALVEDNKVYIVEEGKAKLLTVEVLESSPNELIIKGVSSGTKIITDQKNSAFEGSEIIEM